MQPRALEGWPAQPTHRPALLAFRLTQFAVARIARGHGAKRCGLVEIARKVAASRGSRPKPATAVAPPES